MESVVNRASCKINHLIIISGLFLGSTLFLYWTKRSAPTTVLAQSSLAHAHEDGGVNIYVKKALDAGHTYLAVYALRQLSVKKAAQCINSLIASPTSSYDAIGRLVFDVVIYYQEVADQLYMLDSCFTDLNLFEKTPFLVVASNSDNEDAISLALYWLMHKSNACGDSSLVDRYVDDALKYVVEQNRLDSLERLIYNKVPLTPHLIEYLVCHLQTHNNNADLLSLLLYNSSDVVLS